MNTRQTCLAGFIRRNVDEIVEEWAEFAQTNLPPARDLPPEDLRGAAKVLLRAIAQDMDSAQSGGEQHQKSRGNRPENAPKLTQMARRDADQRFRQGFSLNEMLAEYRALRASVLRRWTDRLRGADMDTLEELVRFNEAIDQAIGESAASYVERVEESRNLLLGVLGHDLRTPLSAARLSTEYLLRSEGLTQAQTQAAARIQSSTRRMREMVQDLLDFTRTRLGGGLPIEPAAADFGRVCRQVVDELEAFQPEHVLRVHCEGELAGEWDEHRLGQLVSNLVSNAMQHGKENGAVTIRLVGAGQEVRLEVHNEGPPIAPEAMPSLFDPTMRPAMQSTERDEGSSGLGLGLYIVREIARAHGGDVGVESAEGAGTTFTVRLPRHASGTRTTQQAASATAAATRTGQSALSSPV